LVCRDQDRGSAPPHPTLSPDVGGEGRVRGNFLAHEVGRTEDFADIEESVAIWRPHRRAVLSVERRQLTIVMALAVTEPDVIVGRAAIITAIPGPRTADVSNTITTRRVNAFTAFRRGDATRATTLDRDAVQFGLGRKARTAV